MYTAIMVKKKYIIKIKHQDHKQENVSKAFANMFHT